MEKKKIIGLVGQIAAGKGTVAKYLEDSYNAKTFKFSTALRDVLKRLHIDISRNNMQDISTILRQKFGEDLLAKVIANDVEKDDSEIIVVDGIRRMADIKHLTKLENFILVSIEGDPEIRYKRLVARNENAGDDKKTYEEFLEDQQREAEAEIPVVMKNAKKITNNNADFNNLYDQIDKIIN